MDASPDVLADTVRAKRVAVDNDLELLRVRLSQADPRRRVDMRRLATTVLPAVAGAAGFALWRTRRRRVRSLEQLLTEGLTDIYHGERQLLPALQRMRAQASNAELAHAFAQHAVETEAQIERLERVFRSVGARPKRGSSAVMAALIAGADKNVARSGGDDVRDAWLIASAQRVEHVEIANYGTVRAHAETLGYIYAAQLLQHTLEEEREMDERLSQLAERFVNPQSIRG